jgi:polysaccharide biosynthesis protein PelB
MLRFALQEQWRTLALADEGAFVRVARDANGRGQRPRLPFDEEVYRLAFDAFLANRNLEDAYEVAAAAVRQSPDGIAWRRRLAQVAQWSDRPQVALEQWLAIARAESRPDDWARVELLAAQLAEGEILLEALRVRALRGEDEALDVRVARMIEDRGEPRAAIDWLATRIEARGADRSAALIERQIVLHEALGDDAGLAAWLDRADAALGPDPRRAMRRAASRIQRGDTAGAFAALQAARSVALSAPAPATDDDTEFWTMYARLASLLQRDGEADLAYRHLLRAGVVSETVLTDWSTVLQPRSPRAAAHVATYAWQRGQRPADAERAFALWLEAGDFGALERLGRTMPPAQLAALTGQRGYLQASSTHLQAQGDDIGARRALERALALAPEDAELRAGLLWLLLAQRESGPLRVALLRWERAAEHEPQLWGPYAASWMALDEPQRALRWFVRQARTGRADDYLWQLGYADCLEQNGLADTAWSVRRRAWLELRGLPATERTQQPWREQATLSLAMRFASADAARDALRRLVADRDAAAAAQASARPLIPVTPATSRTAGDPHIVLEPDTPQALLTRVDAELTALGARDPASSDDANPDALRLEARALAAGSRELALSWLLSHEASDAARAWLLSRYANQLARPAWARLSVALASNDRQELAGLLDDLPDWLPRMEQVDAMRATGRNAQAQTLAWTLAAERPAVEDAHRRFVDSALPDASFAQLEASGAEIGVLGLRSQRLQFQVTLRPGLAIGLVADRDRQRSLDPGQLGDVPSAAGRIGATLGWRGETLQADTTVSRFFAVRDRTGIRIDLKPRPDGDRGLSGALALRQIAPESAPLRVGGMKDLAEIRFAHPITARDRIAATVTGVRLDSQDGSTLGTGTLWMLDATHRLRLDYPDVALKALVIRSDWRARPVADTIVAPLVPAALGDPTAAVIPASSTEFAAGVAFGESVAQAYSRALRPFGEALIRSNTVSGAGYSLRGGATMSVFGTDRLSAFLTLLSKTPGIPRSTRAFGLAYQYLF